MKTSIIGFILWVVAATLYIFKIVAHLMEKKDFNIFTIEEIFGLEWIDKIPWAGVQNIMTTLSTTQLAVILFFVGLVLVVFGMFQKK